MKKKDQDLLLLAAVAWFLFFRKPGAISPSSSPHAVGPTSTTATDPSGNIEVRRADGSGRVTAPITADPDNQPNTPIRQADDPP